MKKNYSTLIFLFLFSILNLNRSFASHIIGGSLTYTFNGGSSYTVMLKLYRDCAGTSFPPSVAISVYQADGSLFTPNRNFNMNGGAIINITSVPCAPSPSVMPCVEERTYTTTVNLPAASGGMHLLYSQCCRNPSLFNISLAGSSGETIYTFIPCYKNAWVEDFTLANGTTFDAGATAWTRTLGTIPPASASVNNGEFAVAGSNNGSAIWSSQVIAISSFTAGVNLSVNARRQGTMQSGDSLKIFYSLNGGSKVLFPVNGSLLGNFATPAFANATALVGNTIQIFIHTTFNSTSSPSKIYDLDMVNVYDNTFLPNSSPSFTNLPPLFACSTTSFSINHSATDADGDVLVYSMYTPYNDAPAPTYSNNMVVMPAVTWVPGYSANSPFNSPSPTVTLNPGTGMLTGSANTNGDFVFGVKCQEYRSGILLSEIVRDYQLNVATCYTIAPPPAPVANSNSPLCVGQTMQLIASTIAGATYSWTGPGGFASNVQNPSVPGVTLLNAGTYSVQAIVSGCGGSFGTTAVVVSACTGINELSGVESGIKMYPNPIQTIFYLANSDGSPIEISKVQVRDICGKEINCGMEMNSNNELKINFGETASEGCYFLIIQLKDGTSFTKKLIKIRD